MRDMAERNADWTAVLRALMDSVKCDIRVAMPGIVMAWDPSQQTVTVKLTIREKIAGDGYEKTETEIPLLVDVPVVMPRAGGYGLFFAPQRGDECLVVFSDMCIDSWWQSGGIQSQADKRRHDLSDGFAVLGCWSQVRKPEIPAKGVRLSDDSGTAGVSIVDGTVDIFGTVRINGQVVS